MAGKVAVANVTTKGQVTVPAEIRRYLGVGERDKLAFHIDDDGEVRIEKVKYPTIASIAGIAGCLRQQMSWEEMQDIAHEDVARQFEEQQRQKR